MSPVLTGYSEKKLKVVSISFFRWMKRLKKSHVGAVPAHMLYDGGFKIINSVSNVLNAVYYLPGPIK